MSHRRPTNNNLRNIVEYLHSIGIYTYGSWTDLKTGEQRHGYMDLGAEDIVKYRKLYEKGELFHEKEDR